MICQEYEDLSHVDKITLIGKAVHALQSDSKCFEMIKEVVEIATLKGLFNCVTFMPESIKDQNY
jgi:hypothetical protein